MCRGHCGGSNICRRRDFLMPQGNKSTARAHNQLLQDLHIVHVHAANAPSGTRFRKHQLVAQHQACRKVCCLLNCHWHDCLLHMLHPTEEWQRCWQQAPDKLASKRLMESQTCEDNIGAASQQEDKDARGACPSKAPSASAGRSCRMSHSMPASTAVIKHLAIGACTRGVHHDTAVVVVPGCSYDRLHTLAQQVNSPCKTKS